MDEDRILAYKKASLLTDQELTEITGGNGAKLTVNCVTTVTGMPPSDIEMMQIYD